MTVFPLDCTPMAKTAPFNPVPELYVNTSKPGISSSMIVTVLVPMLPSVVVPTTGPPAAFVRITKKVSLPSPIWSLSSVTVMLVAVCPVVRIARPEPLVAAMMTSPVKVSVPVLVK